MEKEIKDLLRQILANQVVIYKEIDEIKQSAKGSHLFASMKHYVDELEKKSKEVLPHI